MMEFKLTMGFKLSQADREEKEKQLIQILIKLKETEEDAISRAKALSDAELVSEITDAGMCVDWE
jgi:hypothetical protein